VKFYVTTPIYYPNSKPHLGSAFSTIIAHYLYLLYKQHGYDSFFLTGMDEHGEKIENKAKQANKTPQQFVDEMAGAFQTSWQTLGITPSYFIRTTHPQHKKVVQQVLQYVYDKGFIYKGRYSGYYCVDCERYYGEDELLDGKRCPYHNKIVEKKEIDAYFFKLSAFKEQVVEFIKEHVPKIRQKELLVRVEDLKDLCISRPKEQVSWGIELPFDPKHVTYVWFDALLNYYSALVITGKENMWPPDVHVIGKDILWFHAVIWPAMLSAMDKEMPHYILSHGFLTVNKQKMSKSLGNVVDPVEVAETFGSDALRYYLLSKTSLHHDSDFSITELKKVYNNELAAIIGNTVNRVFTLIKKFGSQDSKALSVVEENKNKIAKKVELKDYEWLIEQGTRVMVNNFNHINTYLSQQEPWKKQGLERKVVIGTAFESLKIALRTIQPLLPKTVATLEHTFNKKVEEWKANDIKPIILFKTKE